MLGSFRSMGLYAKVAILGGGSVLLTASALLGLAYWQSGEYGDLAQKEADKLIGVDLDHIALGIHRMVVAQDQALTDRLAGRMTVAAAFVDQNGLEPLERMPSSAGGSNGAPIDRFTFGQGFASVYRYSSDGKSLICTATGLRRRDGRRAVGAKIGPLDDRGRPSPIVDDLSWGRTHFGTLRDENGRFYVAVKPVRDAVGKPVGAFLVGFKKEVAEREARQAARETKLGTTGYVFVLEAHGPNRGMYLVSKDGSRDGENIWNVSDYEGHHVAREVIEKGLAVRPGEIAMHRYKWMNPGDAAPNYKIARITYFAKWDWVIGAGITETELSTFDRLRRDGLNRMFVAMALAGLLITLLIVGGSIRLAWTLARPVRRLRTAVERVTAGDYSQEVPVESQDEIGALAQSFNYMTGMLRTTVEGLELSEAKYRGVVENAVEGIFTSTAEGQVLSANPAFAAMFGYADGREVVELVRDARTQLYADPEGRDRFRDQVFEKGTVVGYETQVKRKDGTVFWAAISARCLRAPDGTPTILEGFLIDISERKRAEQALAEERQLFIGGPNVSFRWKAVEGWPVTYVSPNVTEQFGYTVQEITAEGFTYASIVHPDDVKRVGDELESYAESGVACFEQEYRVAKKAGEFCWVYGFTTVVRDHTGAITHFQGHIKDVSDWRRAVEELQSNEARLRLLNEIDRSILGVESPIGIARSAIGKIRNVFQCDLAAVTFNNGQGCFVGAFDCSEGLPDLAQLPWPVCERHMSLLRNGETCICDDLGALDERCPSEDLYYSMGLRSRVMVPMVSSEDYIGSLVLASRRTGAFREQAVQIAGELANQLTIAVVQARLHEQVQKHAVELERRVDERTDQLAAANRELESFSYSVSHDLRAPLRSIDGFSRIVVEDYGNVLPEEARDYLRRVTEATERMGSLIDNLLELSRLTRTKIHVVEVDLSGIASEVALALQQAEPNRKVHFHIQPDLKAQGDPTLIQSLMGNLLDNAWKYTSKHRSAKIEFGATKDGDATTYYVRDDGAGFDMAYADKLFGPFQRLHSPSEFPGNGIGLAGVSKIVHRHGGRIWAEAKLEKGATFFFTLAAGEELG